MPNPHAAQFAGRWIGETQGYEMPAHIWDIRVVGDTLYIESRWENDTALGRMSGRMHAEQASFTIGRHTAVLVDPQHFIIPGWDTNDTRGGIGPDYDVVFSRPGLPELQASQVWERFRAAQSEGTPEAQD
jgi:hypothetical protein